MVLSLSPLCLSPVVPPFLAIVKLRAADFSLPSSVGHVSLVACLLPRVVTIYSKPLSLLLPPAMALQRVADASFGPLVSDPTQAGR